MSTREPHYLDMTKGTSRPSNVIFFDTETTPEPAGDNTTRQVLRLGIAWHTRTIGSDRLRFQSEIVFRTPPELWAWVERCARSKTTTYLVAHNIVFDLTVARAWDQLLSLGWKLDSFYTKGITSLFRWSKGKSKIIGVDNTNLFPGKLELWGGYLGLPKLKVDFKSVSDADLIVYCRRDVEIMARLWGMWLEFLDVNRCGSFKSTVGATAFNTWRHSYKTHKIFIHNDLLALQLEREAYHGARSECFYQGRREDGPFHYLDVNNMYGYVLSRYEFPCQLVGTSERTSLVMLLRKLEKYGVIARVALEVDRPVFPYIYHGHTCYPVGQFDTTLTTPEIMLAWQNGWIRGIGASAWYHSEPLFRDYILHWHNLRHVYNSKGLTGFANICKLLNNSLYGKFGQTGFDQRVIGPVAPDQIFTMPIYNLDTGEYYRQIALGGTLYEEHKQGEGYNSFPAIAAHVTAFARLYLDRLVRMAGAGNCFYVDTDSLLVNERGKAALAPLISPSLLGCLKTETSSSWIEVNAPKDYAMQDRIRIKGIREDAVNVGEWSYEQDQWVRLSGMLQRGSVSDYLIRQIVKHQNRVIYSGVVGTSGWVEPFRLAASCLSGGQLLYSIQPPPSLPPRSVLSGLETSSGPA